MVQAKADVRSTQLRSLLRTLARDTTRIELTERRLVEAEQTAGTLKKQLRDEQRAAQQAERSLAVLEQALRQIAGLEHGKRTDRRLARAQRIANQALKRADKVRAARVSSGGRPSAAASTSRS